MEPGYDETAFESPPRPASGSNGMGVAGFVVSLVGFVLTCGILCPLGLIFSLVGLARPPRGLAIAGTVIGGLGSLLLVAAISAYFLIPGVPEVLGTLIPLGEAAATIDDYHQREGKYPDNDEGNELIANLRDGWGRPFLYERTEPGYAVRSAGLDGKYHTGDDIPYEK